MSIVEYTTLFPSAPHPHCINSNQTSLGANVLNCQCISKIAHNTNTVVTIYFVVIYSPKCGLDPKCGEGLYGKTRDL